MIVHNVPQIPSRTLAIGAGDDAPFLPMLAGIRLLEQAGVEVIAIACNTAHFWFDRLARSSRVPVLHIADAVAEAISQCGSPVRRVALMATRETGKIGIYHQRLSKTVEELTVPAEPIQQLLDLAIAAVKANDLARGRQTAHHAARQLLDAGADLLLVACTELSVAMAGNPLAGQTIDAAQVLAQACVRFSLDVPGGSPAD